MCQEDFAHLQSDLVFHKHDGTRLGDVKTADVDSRTVGLTQTVYNFVYSGVRKEACLFPKFWVSAVPFQNAE